MRLQNPLALLSLLLLVPILWAGWPGRGFNRRREFASLGLRALIIVLLVVAAAGPELKQGSDALAVVFLVDASDSITEKNTAAAEDYIARSLARMRSQDQAAVIVFGSDALIERPMSGQRELLPFSSIPNTTQTDMAEAVRLGMALYPPDAARRMVLLTDGRETSGNVIEAISLAQQSGVELLVVPLEDELEGTEVTLLDVHVPERLIESEAFDLSFTAHATAEVEVLARIFAGGALEFEGVTTLVPGTQTFRIPLIAGEPGFTPYLVQLSATSDVFPQNNRLAAFTTISGPPKVLLIAPPEGEPLPAAGATRPDEFSHLVIALESAGFTVDRVTPAGLPFELSVLSEYASLVLVDVPARDLSDRQMEAVQSYVRDLGGGLLAIGGPTSYGVGGYFRTPLEETLPVDMEIKDQERRPGLTIVFIIDHSGSMTSTNGGVTKLDLAKEAAIRSVELLFPGDKVGVIAFDDSASWVVPITDLTDPQAVITAIEAIGAGGGTDILAGLRAMADVLPGDDSLVKHVILLTDGGASPSGIPELVEELNTNYGITLTTVGVGSDSAPFLQDIALLGGGRYHFTDRPESIPNIFTEETTLATRSYIVEESFFPALAGRSPILGQIDALPPLHGYVAASAKDTARTILVSGNGDPILTSWQYGLGKAVAWTSDATTRWARDWVAWEGFATFWTQAVRFTVSERPTSPLQIAIDEQGDEMLVTVDGVTAENDFLNNYTFSVNVIAPDGTVQATAMAQTAPGRYQATFTPDQEGVYLLRFDGVDPGTGERVGDLAGWVLSYSPEYRTILQGTNLIPQIVAAGGGSLLDLETVDPVFSPPATREVAGLALWPYLITAALLLLPFDIAVRRLAFEWSDFARAWGRLRGRLSPQPSAAGAGSSGPRRLTGLLQAKERVSERHGTGDKTSAPVVSAPLDSQRDSQAPEEDRGAVRQPAQFKPDPEGQSDEMQRPRSTTKALLDRMRARRERSTEEDE